MACQETSPAVVPPCRLRPLADAGWDRLPKKDEAEEANCTPLCDESCVVYVEQVPGSWEPKILREELELLEFPRKQRPPIDLSQKDRHVEAERD